MRSSRLWRPKIPVNATDKEIDAQWSAFAKGMQTDAAGLGVKLESQGIAISSLKQYVAAQIAFARFWWEVPVKVKVEPAEVDRKLAEIKQDLEQKVSSAMNDPRMKAVQATTFLKWNCLLSSRRCHAPAGPRR
jgi:hypothetical protein